MTNQAFHHSTLRRIKMRQNLALKLGSWKLMLQSLDHVDTEKARLSRRYRGEKEARVT